MSAAREELVRVDSWGELRVGILIVAKGCDTCGVDHRGILVALRNQSPARDPLGNVIVSDFWNVQPSIPCRPDNGGKGFCFTRAEVADGLVYRVVDGLSSDQSHASRRDRLLEEVTK